MGICSGCFNRRRPSVLLSRVGFKDIPFGFASAEVESAESPSLLLEGFLDPGGVVPALLEGRKFLVLGPKGAGKSALGIHLAMLSETRHDVFVSLQFLGDLSYGTLGELIRDDIELELRYPKAWTWLLLLSALDTLALDEGLLWEDPSTALAAVKILRREGLLPVDNLSRLVGMSSNRRIELSGWGVTLASSSNQPRGRLSLGVLSEHLKQVVASARTDSTHIIVIDGLDDILLSDNVQLHALSGLILEASRLNQYFRMNATNVKIVVLCRTDIFERLPGPNQNKIRQDLAIEINWFDESGDPASSNLVQLVNLRANHYSSTIEDVFTQCFPEKIRGAPALPRLLRLTRHTPRDFIQLLRHIQERTIGLCPRDKAIRAGVRAYAEKYFLPELRNELQGALVLDEIDEVFRMLRQFHLRRFWQHEFEDFLQSRGRDQLAARLDTILSALFNSCAIGNSSRSELDEPTVITSFKHRSAAASYNSHEQVVCHVALSIALQLVHKRQLESKASKKKRKR